MTVWEKFCNDLSARDKRNIICDSMSECAKCPFYEYDCDEMMYNEVLNKEIDPNDE